MSIDSLSTLAQTTAAPANVDANDLKIALLCLAVAAIVAWFAGVFRRGSVVGRVRLEAGQTVAGIWGVGLMGFAMWLLLPTFFVTAKVVVARTPTTAGATLPATQSTDVPMSPIERVGLSVLGAAGALAVLILGNIFIRPNGLRALGLAAHENTRHTARDALVGFGIAFPLTLAASTLVQLLWKRFGFEQPQEHQMLTVFREAGPGLRGLVLLSAVVLTPMFEETLFRGHLQTALAGLFGGTRWGAGARWAAIVISAVAFAGVHEAWWMMPPLFLLAVCFGYAYERTGNLWVPIAMHAGFNLSSIAMEIVFR